MQVESELRPRAGTSVDDNSTKALDQARELTLRVLGDGAGRRICCTIMYGVHTLDMKYLLTGAQ